MKLKNKVALITGSSRGIGRAIALEMAREGASIVVNYSNSKDRAESVVEEILQSGGQAIAVKADVSVESEVKNMVDQSIKQFGKLDILVNNAGIVFDVPFMEKSVEHWIKTISVNLIGTFLCCKYTIPHISEGGRIINISSTNGINTVSTASMDYDASKAGILSITKSLAQELAPKILVNSISPGWVDTEINKDLPADYIKSESERIAVGRFGKAEEVAKVATFLASDDSSFINGTNIVVDGGFTYV